MFAALDPTARLIVVLALLAGLYALSGLLWPYTACNACKAGKHASPTGKNWRDCGRCGGSGKKIRQISRLLGKDD
ncbi:hypothetical protein [Amycolatopsis sp. ATCC 39116]|uniref:hypothetical protein n=1 Tax=Amycolatopsis sp. (strain ATCC 39116 / 75iv2) TaxID=385957 RepID=UPI0002625CEC|nr:hypothetical protein [Amycolatopsis sp. ATCC 39116]